MRSQALRNRFSVLRSRSRFCSCSVSSSWASFFRITSSTPGRPKARISSYTLRASSCFPSAVRWIALESICASRPRIWLCTDCFSSVTAPAFRPFPMMIGSPSRALSALSARPYRDCFIALLISSLSREYFCSAALPSSWVRRSRALFACSVPFPRSSILRSLRTASSRLSGLSAAYARAVSYISLSSWSFSAAAAAPGMELVRSAIGGTVLG